MNNLPNSKPTQTKRHIINYKLRHYGINLLFVVIGNYFDA